MSKQDGMDTEQEKSDEELDSQEAPIAICKLYNSFANMPHPIARRRMWSSRTDCLSVAGERDKPPLPTTRAVNDLQHESARQLGPEPTNMRNVKASPEWPQYKTATEHEVDS